jgi:class 3 adenylate cyclase
MRSGSTMFVVGDTVDVASRLERLTRELDVELMVSD